MHQMTWRAIFARPYHMPRMQATGANPTVSLGGCTRRVRIGHSPAADAAASSAYMATRRAATERSCARDMCRRYRPVGFASR